MDDLTNLAVETSVNPPVQDKAHLLSVPPNMKYSNAQPLWHLVLLDTLSFGLYFIYWSYRNLKDIKECKKTDINPVTKALALLIPIVGLAFLWEQLVAFKNFTEEAGIKNTFSPNWMMTGVIVFNGVSRLPDPYWLLSILVVVPVVIMQNKLNQAWANIGPGLKVRKLPTIEDLLAVVLSWVIMIAIGLIWG